MPFSWGNRVTEARVEPSEDWLLMRCPFMKRLLSLVEDPDILIVCDSFCSILSLVVTEPVRGDSLPFIVLQTLAERITKSQPRPMALDQLALCGGSQEKRGNSQATGCLGTDKGLI